MKVIVPLAGPDFVRRGSTKAEHVYKGKPLLRYTLESRFWWKSGQISDQDLIFVLHDDAISRRFAEKQLKHWYPACQTVFLSEYTRGAAFSSLAAISLLSDMDETLCFDLVDIFFECESDPVEFMCQNDSAALALTFESQEPAYSYIRLDGNGLFIEAAEKNVISKIASAGAYFYRSVSDYLSALSEIVKRGDKFTHNDLYYVCPLFNGVKMNAGKVGCFAVKSVDDIKFSEGVK